MNIDPVIAQLRRYCPMFENRVFGAADMERARNTTFPISFPSAYVLPRADMPSENVVRNGIRQDILEQVDVYVVLDNSADRRGQASVTSVDAVRAALFRALLGWQYPETGRLPMTYAGGNHDGIDNARLWWVFTFGHTIQITSEDGFIPDGEEVDDFLIEATPTDFAP